MFDDPSGAGTTLLSAPLLGSSLPLPLDQVSLSPYPSGMKKSDCRPACALLPGNATGWGTRFRLRLFAL
jgi:hypothetical protein